MSSEGYYWNSTAYSSTTDLVTVEDEVAIAKAEVKYKNTTTEIENQDKKYDQDLKKLDSEHNALQTEYESLKSVIDKNVERSFKAFSQVELRILPTPVIADSVQQSVYC